MYKLKPKRTTDVATGSPVSEIPWHNILSSGSFNINKAYDRLIKVKVRQIFQEGCFETARDKSTVSYDTFTFTASLTGREISSTPPTKCEQNRTKLHFEKERGTLVRQTLPPAAAFKEQSSPIIYYFSPQCSPVLRMRTSQTAPGWPLNVDESENVVKDVPLAAGLRDEFNDLREGLGVIGTFVLLQPSIYHFWPLRARCTPKSVR
jgi:hypothetical protein